MNESNIDSEMGFGFPYLSISRHIKGGFSIGAQYNIGESKINKLAKDYVSIDGFLKYNLSEKKFIPFLIGGYGLSNFLKMILRQMDIFRPGVLEGLFLEELVLISFLPKKFH